MFRGGLSISGFHPLDWSLSECLEIIKDLVFVCVARKQLYGQLRNRGGQNMRGDDRG